MMFSFQFPGWKMEYCAFYSWACEHGHDYICYLSLSLSMGFVWKEKKNDRERKGCTPVCLGKDSLFNYGEQDRKLWA